MDTEKRFGITKWKAIALFVQFLLTVAATASTAYILGFSIANRAGALFTAVYCMVLLSYVAVIFYAVYGYKQSDSYFLGAVYAFCVAIQLNILLPFRSTYQLVTLTILLGLYVAFAQHLKTPKVANWLLLCMVVFAVAFSVYATATARVENVDPDGRNLIAVIAMYLSVWTPVMVTVTLGLAYSVRKTGKTA